MSSRLEFAPRRLSYDVSPRASPVVSPHEEHGCANDGAVQTQRLPARRQERLTHVRVVVFEGVASFSILRARGTASDTASSREGVGAHQVGFDDFNRFPAVFVVFFERGARGGCDRARGGCGRARGRGGAGEGAQHDVREGRGGGEDAFDG